MDKEEIKDEVKEKAKEAKEKFEEVKEDAKEKVSEAKKEAKEVKEEVKEKAEDNFEQIKTKTKKKKRPIRNFFITLLVLIILCAIAIVALVLTGTIKFEYLKSFAKYPKYKAVSNAFEKTIDQKVVKTNVNANFNIDGIEDEVKEQIKEYQEIAKNTSFEISQVLNKEDELENLRVKANSMDEDLIDVLAKIKDGKVVVAEDKLLEKKYNLKFDQLEDSIKEINEALKKSKTAYKKFIELINSSVKMKGEFGQLIDIEKAEEGYILTVNKKLDAKRFIEALDTIDNEVREGKPREKFEELVENIDVNTLNVKKALEGGRQSGKDKTERAGDIIDIVSSKIKELKEDEKEQERIDEALKELKKSSVIVKTKAGKIDETEINVKFEIKNSGYSLGSKNLDLEVNLNAKYDYDKKIKKEIEEKLDGEAKDINSEEELEKEFKNLDFGKILEKVENFKIVKKLNLNEQVRNFRKIAAPKTIEEDEKDKDKEKDKDINKDKEKTEDRKREEKNNKNEEKLGDENSRFTEEELEEIKKEIRKELEKEYNEKENKEQKEEKEKTSEKDKMKMRTR